MKRISVNISDDLYDRISLRTEEGKPLSWQIRDDLEAYYQHLRRHMDRMRRYRDATGRHPDSSSKVIAFSTKAFSINPEVLSSWKETFPAISVELEVRRAHEWILANPKNRKSNYHRYLVNWLSKAQDRAPRVQVEPERIRPAVLDEQNGDVSPMPAEIREQMRKIIEGVKMP